MSNERQMMGTDPTRANVLFDNCKNKLDFVSTLKSTLFKTRDISKKNLFKKAKTLPNFFVCLFALNIFEILICSTPAGLI